MKTKQAAANLRAEIERQTREFLANGGKIQQAPAKPQPKQGGCSYWGSRDTQHQAG